MIQDVVKPEVNLDAWEELMKKGITNAISGLSQMVQKRITVDSVSISRIPAKEVIDLMGGPETLIVGIYLNFSGAANGHLMLAHRPEVAYALLGMILGEEPTKRDDLSDYEQSALGEMGNITGSFFLNAIADTLGITLYPSPPSVIIDMAGAIMGIALAEILQESDEVMVVDTAFTTDDQSAGGRFMIMPNESFVKLSQHCAR
jgi:chemotaxis protein CheC